MLRRPMFLATRKPCLANAKVSACHTTAVSQLSLRVRECPSKEICGKSTQET